MEDISRETLEQACRGDMEAFEQVYRKTCGFVFNVALRVTNSRHDAEEVTQDVFMKIFRKLKTFGFRSSFRTWLYRITVNTAINSLRKQAKERRQQDDYDTVIRTQGGYDPRGSAAEQGDNEQLVAAALAGLNPDQRTCIVLREIEGLSYQEISEALRININTVRSRLKRAREVLLEAAKDEGGKYGL